MSERLWHLLSGKLDEIAAFYKVRPRITLIVRVPGKPKECAFLSDDAWPDAVATVRDLYGDPTAFVAGPPEPVAEVPVAPASDEVREAAEYIARCAGCGRDSCDEFENCRRFDGMDHETLVLTCAEDTRKARALLAALSRDAKGVE